MPYRFIVRPGQNSPLDQVEAYVAEDGTAYLPGEEGYVEKPADEQPTTSAEAPKSPLEMAAEGDGPEPSEADIEPEGQVAPESGASGATSGAPVRQAQAPQQGGAADPHA